MKKYFLDELLAHGDNAYLAFRKGFSDTSDGYFKLVGAVQYELLIECGLVEEKTDTTAVFESSGHLDTIRQFKGGVV